MRHRPLAKPSRSGRSVAPSAAGAASDESVAGTRPVDVALVRTAKVITGARTPSASAPWPACASGAIAATPWPA
jgi:hypothetical protein